MIRPFSKKTFSYSPLFGQRKKIGPQQGVVRVHPWERASRSRSRQTHSFFLTRINKWTAPTVMAVRRGRKKGGDLKCEIRKSKCQMVFCTFSPITKGERKCTMANARYIRPRRFFYSFFLLFFS